ncbi:MAG: AAA family ATPase, partial [Candidatus Omnitrophica bacterium]|nr:AAA family ATPase [Candidatus Omnitrophota bacterium]
MYEAYWNLKERPFQNTPDPRYLYLSPQHEDVLMKLTYAIVQGLGCALLTGVFGCGKTLIARVILRDLGNQRFCWAYVNNPAFSEPAELIRAILRSLSPQSLPEKKTELLIDPLLERLYNVLLDNVREGKENVIVIDEAHIIEDTSILEQLRLILNFQTEERFLLTLLILGQPELKSKIDALKPLSQRIAVRCHLGTLNEEEVDKYIAYRLKIAKGSDSANNSEEIFDKEAAKLIFLHTGGIPRKINTLCDFVLLSGFAKKVNRIDSSFIETVI